MQYSADGSQLYVVLESPAALNAGAASALHGVYVSRTGGAAGPYNQIANPSVLAQSGSAERKQRSARGTSPACRPGTTSSSASTRPTPNHVYVGLEEVYESWNGGSTWNDHRPLLELRLLLLELHRRQNTCDGNVMHSDQHTIAFGTGSTGAGQVYVGNDGGLYRAVDQPSRLVLDVAVHVAAS